jgi:hypothetical protein
MNESLTSQIDTLSADELELLEQLFRDKLPESPIDLESYKELAKTDEGINMTLESMLKTSLRYTEDVARLERFALENPGVRDEERMLIDETRTRTHNATISDINIFARTLRHRGHDVNWLKWQPENRGAYGSFAIKLTLNRFRNDIIGFRDQVYINTLEALEKGKIDTAGLGSLNATEIKVVQYVELLIELMRESESDTDTHIKFMRTKAQELGQIRSSLNRTEEEILGAFHRIYTRRY